MTLADWVLAQIRAALPNEPIFDGPRTGRTFDGVPVPASVRRLVVVHIVEPSHRGVTLTPTKDVGSARIIVHTFALTRREINARRDPIIAALKNREPADDRYSWSLIEHDEALRDDPDLSVPAEPQWHAIDVFKVSGIEK